MDKLEQFHFEFQNSVIRDADAEGSLQNENFFELITDILSEAGEIDSGTWSHFEGTWKRKLRGDARELARGLAVSGYGGDPNLSDGTLSLILTDFKYSESVRELGAPDVRDLFSKLVEFLRASRNEGFKSSIEETSDGAILCDLISQRWPLISNIKLILATNASTKSTVDARSAGSLEGIDLTYNIWDLKRLQKYLEQGQAREDLLIDFENDFGGGLPTLKAFKGKTSIESYLVVISGTQLSDIYQKWGPRLLESNVRSFLQARGNVNKGIRDTIINEPEMFLSYNNGITATANSLTLKPSDQGLLLANVENLQIVNGGQTTASLHALRKTASEQISQVYVQMKLNIVPQKLSEEIVPKISEYANTQNKVNAADFFSNHPFHIRMEVFSRKTLAPAGENHYQETKWFYERARGQYADSRASKTLSERKKFDAEYPRSGFFTKTDLAKYENTFNCEPHIVSLGAQKNFASFAKNIGAKWGDDGFAFDETWYKRLIAKAIIFKATERLVSSAADHWYEGGYRANIVTYGIAKLVYDVTQMKKSIDLDRVWRLQRMLETLESALNIACAEAQIVILNPAPGMRHIGEWAKKQACWKNLQEKELNYPREFIDALIDPEDLRAVSRDNRKDQELTASLIGEKFVLEAGAKFWKDVHDWGLEKKALSPSDVKTLSICEQIPNKIPTDYQAKNALKCLKKLEALGFAHPRLKNPNMS